MIKNGGFEIRYEFKHEICKSEIIIGCYEHKKYVHYSMQLVYPFISH